MVLSNDNVTQPALLSGGRLGSQGIIDILGLAGYGIRHVEEPPKGLIDFVSKLARIGPVA